MIHLAAFLLISALTLAGGLAAALLRNLVHCALSLTVTFAGLALLYLDLDAQFVGFSQILVYIGAVAILVVFAILLTRNASAPVDLNYSGGWGLGLVVSAAIFAVLGWAILKTPFSTTAGLMPEVTVRQIGQFLMGPMVLPLEIVAVLLTVALIGAVIVAMPEAKDSARASENGGSR
uniref:NADH:ubiquinone oxidoreductase, membrane subunit J n=1 Tax=mine drainage metagenome TaxID=410659 RepID=E6QMJ3_9ZZZZ